MSPLVGAASITDKTGERIRLQMGPVGALGGDIRGGTVGLGKLYRATLEPNGWGPSCWHSSPEGAIDCLHRRIAEGYRR